MERLGGGGHLTNAATQMEGTVKEAVEKLKQVLKQMIEEEGFFNESDLFAGRERPR
jgi:c-di-AMP phosphodiesterase-like protein